MPVKLAEYYIDILEFLDQLSNVDEFYMRVCNLKDLILQNDPTYKENYFVACFIQGLNPVIVDYVRNCVPHTLHSAYETALHKELELTKARQFSNVPTLEETAEAIVSEEIFINADHCLEEPRFDNIAAIIGADSSHMMPISGGLLHVPLDNAAMGVANSISNDMSLKEYLQTSRHVNAIEDLEEYNTNVDVIWSSSFDKVVEHSCVADNGVFSNQVLINSKMHTHTLSMVHLGCDLLGCVVVPRIGNEASIDATSASFQRGTLTDILDKGGTPNENVLSSMCSDATIGMVAMEILVGPVSALCLQPPPIVDHQFLTIRHPLRGASARQQRCGAVGTRACRPGILASLCHMLLDGSCLNRWYKYLYCDPGIGTLPGYTILELLYLIILQDARKASCIRTSSNLLTSEAYSAFHLSYLIICDPGSLFIMACQMSRAWTISLLLSRFVRIIGYVRAPRTHMICNAQCIGQLKYQGSLVQAQCYWKGYEQIVDIDVLAMEMLWSVSYRYFGGYILSFDPGTEFINMISLHVMMIVYEGVSTVELAPRVCYWSVCSTLVHKCLHIMAIRSDYAVIGYKVKDYIQYVLGGEMLFWQWTCFLSLILVRWIQDQVQPLDLIRLMVRIRAGYSSFAHKIVFSVYYVALRALGFLYLAYSLWGLYRIIHCSENMGIQYS